jgi:uncharacterized protein (TIGR01244 family)
MNYFVILGDAIVGPQPTEEALRQLKEQGFQTVIDFRESNDKNQLLRPEEEARHARELGMLYFHLPICAKKLAEKEVDLFRRELDCLPKPVFAHCVEGERAGAMMMMACAVDRGLSGAEALERAKKMGFQRDHADLMWFVKRYIDKRRLPVFPPNDPALLWMPAE